MEVVIDPQSFDEVLNLLVIALVYGRLTLGLPSQVSLQSSGVVYKAVSVLVDKLEVHHLAINGDVLIAS